MAESRDLPHFMDHLDACNRSGLTRAGWLEAAGHPRRVGRRNNQRHPSNTALMEIGGGFQVHSVLVRDHSNQPASTGPKSAPVWMHNHSVGGEAWGDRGSAAWRRSAASDRRGSACIKTTAGNRMGKADAGGALDSSEAPGNPGIIKISPSRAGHENAIGRTPAWLIPAAAGRGPASASMAHE